MNKKVMSAREQSIRAMYDLIVKAGTVYAKIGTATAKFSCDCSLCWEDYIQVEVWGRSAVRNSYTAFRRRVAQIAQIAEAGRTGAFTFGTEDPNRAPFNYGDKVREKGTGRTGWVVTGLRTAAEVMWDGVNGAAQRLEAGVPVDSLIMVKEWAA